jgi:hypothetical protein
MTLRKFIGTKHKIPKGAIVEVIKFYPKRRALVKYQEEEILTFATLLRKLTNSDDGGE